jgi:hypothetical protein
MSQEFMNLLPFLNQPLEHQLLQKQLVLQDPALTAAHHAPSIPAEQLHAVDAVFARDPESHLVAGLMGLWTGSLLLCDLAQEHFHIPADEELKDLADGGDEPDE